MTTCINATKTHLVLFDRFHNYGALDGFILDEKSSFKLLGLSFSSKLDWCLYIVSIAKTASNKIVPQMYILLALHLLPLSSPRRNVTLFYSY